MATTTSDRQQTQQTPAQDSSARLAPDATTGTTNAEAVHNTTEPGRLILVSNRLPITIKRLAEGEYSFKQSSGGLVSGISGLIKTTEFLWYGWPGLQIPEKEIDLVVNRLKNEQSAVPVFFDDELADRHYNGFSSKS